MPDRRGGKQLTDEQPFSGWGLCKWQQVQTLAALLTVLVQPAVLLVVLLAVPLVVAMVLVVLLVVVL